jgi:biopolymer transport protein ExbD
MAGVSVEGGKGKRRAVDTEINMVPMIDLMMVTVSFLLITAVWTHMSRLDGTTQVPGPSDPSAAPFESIARLHVEVPAGEAAYRVTLRRGQAVIDSAELPRNRTPTLAATLESMQKAHAADFGFDESRTVVLHTENDLRYKEMVAVMDAIAAAKDPRGHHGESEFRVNLAVK